MRPRYLKVVVRLSGFEMPLATFKLQKFVDVLEADTDLVCPKCKQKPKWNGGYDCVCCSQCGKLLEKVVGTTNWKCAEHGLQEPSHYNHWSQLLRLDKATGEPIVKTKFTEPDKDVVADAFIMDKEQFQNVTDATLTEYGVIITEETSAKNLRKLLIATVNLGKVILLKFKDTYEERVAILTLSISKRIILKEIVPLNLLSSKESMRADLSDLTPADLAEAEQFIKTLPKATEDLLYVSDYRTKGLKIKPITAKVLELEACLTKAKTALPLPPIPVPSA